MDLWLIVVHHPSGFTAGLVESDHEPGEDEAVGALDLECKTGDDSIEIILMDRAEIKTLQLTHQR